MPGSAVLNVLAGALFGWRGLLLTTLLTSCGASICFLMSRAVGVDAICSYFPSFQSKLEGLRTLVDAEKKNGTLFLWLISARLFPFTPNWLLNMAYPHIGVSCYLHFVTIAIGLLAYNYITVSAGLALSSLSGFTDAKTLGGLLVFFCLFVGLALLSRRRQRVKHS